MLQRKAQEPLLNIINGMFNIHHYKHVDRAYIFKGTSQNVVLIKSVYVCGCSSLAGSADLEWGVHHNSYQPCSLKCIFYITFYMITADELTTIIIFAKINQIEWRRVIWVLDWTRLLDRKWSNELYTASCGSSWLHSQPSHCTFRY